MKLKQKPDLQITDYLQNQEQKEETGKKLKKLANGMPGLFIWDVYILAIIKIEMKTAM